MKPFQKLYVQCGELWYTTTVSEQNQEIQHARRHRQRGEGSVGGRLRDMCTCANLYKCHNRSVMLQPLQGAALSGRRAFGGWDLETYIFFLGVWLFGDKQGRSTCHGGLATAQHLGSPLVSLVNPGLIGISLKEKKKMWMDGWMHFYVIIIL